MLYQFRDWEAYRYDLWQLKGAGFLRGPDPRPLPPAGYVTYLGTAHTFGRFCNTPYPERLRRRYGIPGIDLSTSSVGPRYFLIKPVLLEIANAGRVCVIQAPSARSCSNSLFHNHNTGNNVFQPTGSAPDSPRIHEGEIFNPLFAQGHIDQAAQLAREMKATWVEEMRTLLGLITVPKVLLWFSSRTPDYTPGRKSWQAMCGEFPQLVDQEMIDEVRPLADSYVEVCSQTGLPIRFKNRFVGGPGRCYFGGLYRGEHAYYPSDPMHQQAAEALAPVLEAHFSEAERAVARADPGAHGRMIDLAKREARTPGDADPFAPVQMLQALSGYQLQEAITGRVLPVGKLDPYRTRLVAALAKGGETEGPARLVVVGKLNPQVRPALDAALAELRPGGIVLIDDADRAPLIRRLRREHDLAVAAFVDGFAVLTTSAEAKPLTSWLASAMKEVSIPQFRAKARTFAGERYTQFESRARSQFDIDHAAFR